MSLIHFPRLDKKSYIIIGFIFYSWITYTLNEYVIKGIVPYDCRLFDKICQFLIYIPYFIYLKMKRKKRKTNSSEESLINNNKKNEELRKFRGFTKRDGLMFFIVIILDLLTDNTYTIYYNHLNPKYGDFIKINIRLIFVFIFSTFYSRQIYHRHKIFSQLIIILLTTGIDILKIISKNDNYNFEAKYIILILLLCISEALILSFKHYLLEIKCFRIESVSFLFGFLNFVFTSILILLKHYFGSAIFFNEKNIEFINFEYKTKKDFEKIIFSFITNSIVFLFFYKCLQECTPNHILLAFTVCRYLPNLKESFSEEEKTLYLIIYSSSFIIIFLCVLIFLEIMELNFCKLSYNTRRNILKRERIEEKKSGKDSSINDSNNSNNRTSKIQDGDYIFNVNTKYTIISLDSKNSNESISK